MGVAVDRDDDSFVSDISCICSGHEAGPVEVDVVSLLIDKGSEEVEVVIGGISSDEHDSMSCAQCEYGGGGEPMVE